MPAVPLLRDQRQRLSGEGAPAFRHVGLVYVTNLLRDMGGGGSVTGMLGDDRDGNLRIVTRGIAHEPAVMPRTRSSESGGNSIVHDVGERTDLGRTRLPGKYGKFTLAEKGTRFLQLR